MLVVPLIAEQVKEAGLLLRAHHVAALAATRSRVDEAVTAPPKHHHTQVKPEHQATGLRKRLVTYVNVKQGFIVCSIDVH